MNKYIFRNKKGQFTKPLLRSRVYNEYGQELYGQVKRAVTKKAQKESKKTRSVIKGRRRISKRVPKKRTRDRRVDKISHRVPQALSRSFAWFVENLDNAPDSSERPCYVLIRLQSNSTYLQQLGLEPNTVIPVRLPVNTAGFYKKVSHDWLMAFLVSKGIDKVETIIGIVIKRKKADLKRNKKNNPLIRARKQFAKQDQKKIRKRSRRRL